jgi:uncharacterized protein
MFYSSVPVFVHFLKSLSAILKKAEDYCAAKKIDPAVMLSQRLYPDMLALTRQVQIATDAAKAAGARLAGIAVPSFPDEEKTFAELQARIAKTSDFLSTLSKSQFDGAESRTISFKAGQRDFSLTGAEYLGKWALPNFFFHVTTAYNILRHNGLEIGKPDYLGGGG